VAPAYGMLRFFWDAEQKQLMVLSAGPDFKGTVAVSEVLVDHGSLDWVFTSGDRSLATSATFSPHGLIGKSQPDSGGSPQSWRALEGAPPGKVPYQLASLVTVSDKDLAAAARGHSLVLVPFGYLNMPQGAIRTLRSSLLHL